jgi:SAM-dependent methyltransferase
MWTAAVLILLLLIVMYTISLWNVTEGFDNKKGKSVILSDPDEYYDDFYASFYDALWHTPDKLSYERASFREILLDGKDKTELSFLDLCCGTAPHACWFSEADIKYTGLDKSEGMLAKARTNCPSAKFVKGDALQPSTFSPKSFTTVLVLQNTIYQFQNPKVIAENAAYWLEPGGYCVVHVMHPNKFDPVLELASPFAAFSLQKYSDKRVVDSEVYFDQFKYQTKFKKKEGDDDAEWNEIITYYNPEDHDGVKYREHKQTWTMPSIERITEMFKSTGFVLRDTVDLVSCGREYQYLLYFQK